MDELYSIPCGPLQENIHHSDNIKNIVVIVFVTLIFNIMYISCSMSRLRVSRKALISVI